MATHRGESDEVDRQLWVGDEGRRGSEVVVLVSKLPPCTCFYRLLSGSVIISRQVATVGHWKDAPIRARPWLSRRRGRRTPWAPCSAGPTARNKLDLWSLSRRKVGQRRMHQCMRSDSAASGDAMLLRDACVRETGHRSERSPDQTISLCDLCWLREDQHGRGSWAVRPTTDNVSADLGSLWTARQRG